jgi:hypothetical protein
MSNQDDESKWTDAGPEEEPARIDGEASGPAENKPDPAIEDRRKFLRKLESLAFLTLGIVKIVPPALAHAAGSLQPGDGCGQSAPSGGYYEDTDCVEGGTDNDCGKKATSGVGAGWEDNDCASIYYNDSDCGKKSIAGPAHNDHGCGTSTTDHDCGKISAVGGAWSDNDCIASTYSFDNDCGQQSQGNPSSASSDTACIAIHDSDCGLAAPTQAPTGMQDNACPGLSGPGSGDQDCGVLSGQGGTHSDSDCSSSGSDNTCTNSPSDGDLPGAPMPPRVPTFVI